jgi:hypothetical protein
MTTLKSTYNKDNLRLTKSSGYWWDIIMGGLQTSMIIIPLGGLILLKMNLTNWFYAYALICLAIVVFIQWRDDNLTVIKTGFSKAKNLSLIKVSLDNLNWEYKNTGAQIDLTLNKYFLKFLNPTIINENDFIYINFKYRSTYKFGRPPFYFGISTYLQWTFKRTLLRAIHLELKDIEELNK